MSDVALDERRLASLIDLGRALVSELDLESVLHRVLEVARELTGARYAALGILDDAKRELERFLTLGVDDSLREQIGELPRGRGVLGQLIEHPTPLRLTSVKAHPRSYGFPPAHPPMESFLGVPIAIRGEVYGNLYLTEKRDGDFDEVDEASTAVLAEWAAIAIDNARLYERAERRRLELETAVQTLEATTTITLAIGAETELDRVLELIAKRGRALVEARALVILLVDRGELVVVASAGEPVGDLVGTRMPLEGSVGGEAIRGGRPERLTDVSKRLRYTLGTLGVEASTGMFVPLIFRGRSLGVLEAFDSVRGSAEFSAQDERLLLAFAASAATAVATAKTVAEDRLRGSIDAAELERGRWARELHDETLQALGALRMTLASALQRDEPSALEHAVQEAVPRIDSEIGALRALIVELRPAALDEIGVEAAIQGLLERAASTQGVTIDSELSLPQEAERGAPMSAELQNTIYRVVQEALTNVGKHARAEHVRVRIAAPGSTIEISVEDDGVGFDPEERHDGIGLEGMRERVSMAGGELGIESGPGRGARVTARIPASAGETDAEAAASA